MTTLVRFVLLGAVLFAVAGAQRWPSHHAAITVNMNGEEKLLAVAMARGVGDDDIVVQRRLLETAQQIALDSAADASGLAEGDPIIERRLVQQMRLQLESEARRTEPTDAELHDYFDANADRFAIPQRLRVEQVFFSNARRGNQAEPDAIDALGRMGTTQYLASPDPSLWPARLPLQTVVDLGKIFGPTASVIAAAPVAEWSGPYRSTLGYHLVRVLERVPATMPAFATVRAAVRLALLNDRAEEYVQHSLQ